MTLSTCCDNNAAQLGNNFLTWRKYCRLAVSMTMPAAALEPLPCSGQRTQTLIHGDHGLLSEVSHITGGQLKVMTRPSTVALHRHSAQMTLD